MTASVEQSERELLDRVVEEYDNLGYHVIVEPDPEELPDFLREFRPDAIAQRNDNNVVIELKRTDFIRPRHELSKLADELARHPGWHLRVVVAGAPIHAKKAELPPLSLKNVRQQVSSVEALYDAGQQAAALLLLWSLFEAAAYLQMQERGVERRRPQSPIALAKDMVSLGMIEQADYERLLDVIEIRNKVAHGFPNLGIDKQVYKTLRKVVDMILRSGEKIEAEK